MSGSVDDDDAELEPVEAIREAGSQKFGPLPVGVALPFPRPLEVPAVVDYTPVARG